MTDLAFASLRASERFNAMENIVTHDRGSTLLVVTDEDPVYVVGYVCDIRGLIVNNDLQKFPKAEIALRIGVSKELQPKQDALTYGGTATA